MDQFPWGIGSPSQTDAVREDSAGQASPEFAGGDVPTAGRNGITTGRRKMFLHAGKSSAGQDEMTVTREQSLARQATERHRRSWGSPYPSDQLSSRINYSHCRQVMDCANPLALLKAGLLSESGRGLPQSKTRSRPFKSTVVSWPQRASVGGGCA